MHDCNEIPKQDAPPPGRGFVPQGSARWLALASLLVLVGFLYLQGLGSPYITLWDEAIQVNVIRNLAESSWVPQLHRSEIVKALPGAPNVSDTAIVDQRSNEVVVGTDYRDWTNNTVWLHKPLLPFYLTAAVYRWLGGSLWALRLPGAVFAFLTTMVVYQIGRRFFSDWIGLAGAAIFGLDPYTIALVHGREFAGFPDLAMVLLLSIALYLVLYWTETRSVAALRWMGVAVGIAYLCKGGLALAPFVVLAGIAVLAGSARDFFPILQSFAIFVVIILPEKLYWSAHYPMQFRYESHEQMAHLYLPIEGHHGSLATYLLFFLPGMLAWCLAPFGYFSVVWAMARYRAAQPAYALALWSLTYLIPLSFAASRVENFIYAVLPAMALLIPYVVQDLVRARRFSLSLALCVSALVLYATYVLTAKIRSGPHWHGAILFALFLMLVSFALTWALLSRIHFGSGRVTTVGLALTSVSLLVILVVQDVQSNRKEEADSAAQADLREAGLKLRSRVDPKGLVLVHSDTVDFAYLYVMYWSGMDALDLCRQPDPAETVPYFKNRNDVYLVTNDPLPGAPLAKLPIGNLYSLQSVPFAVWGRLADRGCQRERPNTTAGTKATGVG